MVLTIDIKQPDKLQALIAFLEKMEFDFQAVEKPIRTRKSNEILVQKGDKSLNPEALFGIWKDNPITLEEIRKNNWNRFPNTEI